MTGIFGEDHRGALLRQAYRLVRNVADAQDLVQDTLLRAYTRQEQQRDPGATLAWLRSILYSVFCNRCVRQKRRGWRDQSLDLLPDKSSQLRSDHCADDPERAALNTELGAVLYTAIAGLPASYRECLLLCGVEGLCYNATAARLNITLPVVKSRLHRARRRVRATLESQGYGN
ncbi:MAG: RNA polymerase sigma factor [Akkermansiaceae bacterium]|nr:RNA polymerase sigma factor [Armatimonadota bacterium]